jgi:hypothetical protein
MTEYTDTQKKAVAAWLGLSYDPKRGGKWMRGTDTLYIWGVILRDIYFGNWLHSHEGRCAIEDKFIDEAPTLCCFQSESGIYRAQEVLGNHQLWGEGSTPAEAWLDAAMRYCDKTR